jgi:hypothetical protein
VECLRSGYVLQPEVWRLFIGFIGQFPCVESGACIQVEAGWSPRGLPSHLSLMYRLNDFEIFLLAHSFSLRRFREKV